MILWLLAVALVGMAISMIVQLLSRTTTVGVTRIGIGLVVLVLAPLIYGAAGYWFTFSLDIDRSPQLRPTFEGNPWAVGLGAVAVVGVGLVVSGAVAHRRA